MHTIDMGHSTAIQMDPTACGAPAHPVPGTPRMGGGAIISVRDTTVYLRRDSDPAATNRQHSISPTALVRPVVSPPWPPGA